MTKTTPTTPKTTKAATKNATAKAAPAKKDGLRKPQVRILAALKKAGKAMTRAQIAAKAPVDVALCVEYIGSPDNEKRKANDKKHFPSLITLGLVRQELPGEEGGAIEYEITANGKKALEKAQA